MLICLILNNIIVAFSVIIIMSLSDLCANYGFYMMLELYRQLFACCTCFVKIIEIQMG